jgi:hypothetical protein
MMTTPHAEAIDQIEVAMGIAGMHVLSIDRVAIADNSKAVKMPNGATMGKGKYAYVSLMVAVKM